MRGYASTLLLLLLGRFVLGDRTPLLFVLNSFLLFAFVPLPVMLILSLVARNNEGLVLCLLGVGTWTWLWGGLFWSHGTPAPPGPELTVLSYNALGRNHDTDDTLRVIRDSEADVVAIQELNPDTASAIESQLYLVYPYRWLEPRGVAGMGLLSKFPLERSGPLPDSGWIGRPLVATLSVEGREVTVVAFHAASGPEHIEAREREARILGALGCDRGERLVIAGDLNATDQHEAYAAVTRCLRDGWREVGWGFGHTFPAVRRKVWGISVPRSLLRLDYVFHSPDLVALDAELAPKTEASDHRGVVVTVGVP